MKVTSVDLTPENSSKVATLSFRDPARNNPYNVKTIVGLDADEIVPRHYGGLAKRFYRLAQEKRDIVVRIELNPRFALGETYSDLRDELYKKISLTRSGMLRLNFKNEDEVVATISGFVTKFEASHFTETPEVQLSITCIEPTLRGPNQIEFVAENLSSEETNLRDDLSTSPHGLKFTIGFNTTLPFFRIRDPHDSSWKFEVAPSGGFLPNDILHFSSEFNDKYLYVTRGSNAIHLVDKIVPFSVWPIMFPEDNLFTITNPDAVQWVAASYYPAYWGV
jgi:hypothetical protein